MKIATMIAISIAALSIVGCGTESGNVASLEGKATTEIANAPAVTDEDRAIEFAECLREQGLEVQDPTVDSEGNVQLPRPSQDSIGRIIEFRETFQSCLHLLEGMSFFNEAPDLTEQTDQMIEVASCLREQGLNVDDPNSENLRQWQFSIRSELDFNDPDVAAVIDECGGLTGPRGPGGPGRN